MRDTTGARNRNSQSEMMSLRELSARIGRDPLLVQACSGNTSIKLDGVLWIKASGTWLADVERESDLSNFFATSLQQLHHFRACVTHRVRLQSGGPFSRWRAYIISEKIDGCDDPRGEFLSICRDRIREP